MNHAGQMIYNGAKKTHTLMCVNAAAYAMLSDSPSIYQALMEEFGSNA